MAVHSIHTNLEYDEINDLLLQTYVKWLSFALGKESIGGRTLKNPSGRYASSITADRGPEGQIVAVYIDPNSVGSKEASFIEHGHGPIYLKSKMLQGRTSIHLRLRGSPPTPMGALPGGVRALRSMVRSGGRKDFLRTVGPMRFNKRLARIWSHNYYSKSNYGDEWKTMSSKKGTTPWVVPAMPSFSPARLLRRELPPQIRDRVIIPR